MKKPNKYWTKETCAIEALKYNSRIEFKKKSQFVYRKACLNKWIDDICLHMKRHVCDYKRIIYAFEFLDKSVYIGLTYSPLIRKSDHLKSDRKRKTMVFKYVKKTGLQPEYKELTDYLDKDSAAIKEGEFLEKYKKDGWNILNVNKTGGLGGGTVLWTKVNCITEALKYNSRSSFKKNSGGAYNAAKINNWLDECCMHMIRLHLPNGFWKMNKINCITEALKYKTKIQFLKKNVSAYTIATKNGWLNEICSHMLKK